MIMIQWDAESLLPRIPKHERLTRTDQPVTDEEGNLVTASEGPEAGDGVEQAIDEPGNQKDLKPEPETAVEFIGRWREELESFYERFNWMTYREHLIPMIFGTGIAAGIVYGWLDKPQRFHRYVPRRYGLVVITALSAAGLTQWQALKVFQARIKHKIPPPTAYSESNTAFNCVQRAHHNTLENYTQFTALLLIGGIRDPYFATYGGVVWIFGRIAYSLGYYTGKPENRSWGIFGFGGFAIVTYCSFRTALSCFW